MGRGYGAAVAAPQQHEGTSNRGTQCSGDALAPAAQLLGEVGRDGRRRPLGAAAPPQLLAAPPSTFLLRGLFPAVAGVRFDENRGQR